MSRSDPTVSAVLLAGGESRRMGRPKPFLRIGDRPVAARLLDRAARVASDLLLSVADADPFRRSLPGWGWEPDADAPGDRSGTARSVFRNGDARLRIVPDRRPGFGPLAGVEACAGAADGERCLLVAADLPFASAPLFQALLDELERWSGEGPGSEVKDRPSETRPGLRPRLVLPVIDGRCQPLCSVFERPAGAIAAACLDEDVRSVKAWMERLAVREVDAERLERLMASAPRETGVGQGTRRPGSPSAHGPARQLFDLDTPSDLRRARRWARDEGATIARTTPIDPGGEHA
ncbi:MAG: molybdenum cofactor guanylyltransferase [Gemmatimonadota bacterium]